MTKYNDETKKHDRIKVDDERHEWRERAWERYTKDVTSMLEFGRVYRLLPIAVRNLSAHRVHLCNPSYADRIEVDLDFYDGKGADRDMLAIKAVNTLIKAGFDFTPAGVEHCEYTFSHHDTDWDDVKCMDNEVWERIGTKHIQTEKLNVAVQYKVRGFSRPLGYTLTKRNEKHEHSYTDTSYKQRCEWKGSK